jgi:Sec-independent protein translocase protein TatA
MFGLGAVETGVIIIVAVILFGSQAPKLVGKFFQSTKEIKSEINKGVETLKDEKPVEKK